MADPHCLLIALLVVAGWQAWFDTARAAGTGRDLEWLATCEAPTVQPPDLRAEALRGRRLSESERAATLWRELDQVELDSNLKPNSVVWPESKERWPNEQRHVPSLRKRCGIGPPDSLGDELALVEAVSQAPGEVGAIRRYHAAMLRYRLERPIALSHEALPRVLIASRDLLLAEQAFARNPASAGEAFFALEAKLPDMRSGLRLRQLQAAIAAKDEARIETLLSSGVDAPYDSYFFAMRVVRLERKQDWDAILALARENATAIAEPKTGNAEIARSVVTSALVMHPFERSTLALLEDLFGRGRVSREVFRLGSLAVAKGRLAFARDAFGWILVSTKAMFDRTQSKLAMVALLTGDEVALGHALETLGETESKTLETYESLLVVARSGSAGSTKALARLVTAVDKMQKKSPKNARVLEIQRELHALAKAGHDSRRILNVILPGAQPALVPVAPEVRFTFAEPFTLLDLPNELAE